METDWPQWLEAQKQQPYLRDTLNYVAAKRADGVSVYPPENRVFSAFESTPVAQVKVVILGQDPYHGPNQAHGLCFSVLPEVKIPPSLKNIYKELSSDIEGFVLPQHGYLQSWAQQGVLMLNAVLTVEQGQANSHKALGWEQLTDRAIEHINQQCEGVVFILWGAPAQKKGRHIDDNRHHILKAPHPSPLAAYRGFFGCKHFSKANELLVAQGKTPINWQV
jgi:uracil-DNA glycosylase